MGIDRTSSAALSAIGVHEAMLTRLFSEHVDDGNGLCAGCCWAPVPWPCVVTRTLTADSVTVAADGVAVAILASGVIEVITDRPA